jgi:ribose 1,5-bisphosphokinase PhnN
MTRPYVLLNISGPYGVGKDTILNSVLRSNAAVAHRVSTITTRASTSDADPSYRSVTDQEFEEVTSSGRWVITHQIGGTVLYGTSIDEIDEIAARGLISIHSVYPSDEGAGSLRRQYGNRLISLGVLASRGDRSHQLDVLRDRLLSRGRDDPEAVDARLRYQADAIDYVLQNPVVPTPDGRMHVFDEILINDDLRATEENVRKLWDCRIGPTLAEPALRSDYEIMVSAEDGAHVGGGYYNPVSELKSTAETIVLHESVANTHGLNLTRNGKPTYKIALLFRELSRSLGPSQVLFGIYDRGRYRIAPYINDEERLFSFEEQVADGVISRIAYLAIDAEHADEGLMRDFLGGH